MDSSSQLPDDHEINRLAGEHEPAASTTPIPGTDSGADPQPGPRPERGVKKTTKKTIIDLARYRYGQRVFWIVFRSQRDPNCELPDEQMIDEHPWIRWRYRMMPWNVPMKPPRTHPADTLAIMMLCLQRPKIEPFRIKDITRSANIGCFLYTGSNGMVMPEGLLFPTKKAARREIARIAKMFAAWTGTWEEAARNPPTKE